MKAQFDGGRSAKDARREQACAILWAQVHKDDPAPAFSALPDAQRRQLVDTLGLDASVLMKDTWPTAVVRRAVAFSSPGETPTKKRPGRRSKEQGPGAHGQLSKSGGRAAASSADASDAEVDSDDGGGGPAPRGRSRDPKSKRHGDSGDAERSKGRPGRSRSRGSARLARRSSHSSDSGDGRSGSSSNSGSGSDSDSDSSSSGASSAGSSGGSTGRCRSLQPHTSPSRRGGSRSSKAARGKGGGATGSRRASAPDLSDAARIDRLCGKKWLSGGDLKDGLPSRWYTILHCGHAWDNKKQREYEKACRKAGTGATARREDPNSPAWVHRLSLVHSGDDRLALDASHLALLVRGESMADFRGEEEDKHREREAYTEHLKTLRERWQRVVSSLGLRRLPGEMEVAGVVTSLKTTLARRYTALKGSLGRGRAAMEVLANTARQYREAKQYFEQFRCEINLRADSIEDYDARVEYLGGRLLGLLRPAVEVVLSMESYDASKDALSLGRSALPSAAPAADQGGSAAKRPRKEQGSGSATAAVTSPPTQQSGQPCGVPAPVAGPQAYPVAQPMFQPPSWGYAYPPMQGLGFAAPLPPPYQPPMSAPSVRTPAPSPAAGAGSLAAGPAAKRSLKVSFADGAGGQRAAGAGLTVKKEKDQSQDELPYSPATGYLGLPAHAWVCGANAAPPPPADGSASFTPPCRCGEALGFPGPHATWNCPLRYFARRGSCPGFLPTGERDPAAWAGDNITDETKRRWKRFVSAHDGKPALELAKSARTGPPNFD